MKKVCVIALIALVSCSAAFSQVATNSAHMKDLAANALDVAALDSIVSDNPDLSIFSGGTLDVIAQAYNDFGEVERAKSFSLANNALVFYFKTVNGQDPAAAALWLDAKMTEYNAGATPDLILVAYAACWQKSISAAVADYVLIAIQSRDVNQNLRVRAARAFTEKCRAYYTPTELRSIYNTLDTVHRPDVFNSLENAALWTKYISAHTD